ncbi:cytochrome c-type biogenesis protein [Lautropia mirabilis ATCC 51599]|uniref:Cytochrome c-type biogenesis protein n=1 Tax=Lautropia mirabilis ATCC 51599 TaxID=887898 RepID=E7RXN6_9BURK|nr:cytochrome c-type biogenesis protein [Lautropia mirabilis]EFV94710.1 cytochrome C biogenesis protein [Lautropia mirabilis ATCC 51599]VEH01245.1 Cytochrome c-type biogenesis protein CcmH precursor [Lautropia mirabilis]
MTSRYWAACLGLAAALMVGPVAPVAAVTPVQAVPAATGNATNDSATGSAAPDAAQSSAPHADAQAEAIMRTSRFRGLAAELRCLVCQNQTLLDSHADLAKDLRMEVVRLIQEGRDDAEVKRYLVDRYGEFVLYRPTWSWRNGILWLGPLVLLAVAGAVIWRLTHKRKLQEDELDDADDTDDDGSDGEDDETPPLSTEDAMKQVDALLARTAEEPAAPTHVSSRKTDS